MFQLFLFYIGLKVLPHLDPSFAVPAAAKHSHRNFQNTTCAALHLNPHGRPRFHPRGRSRRCSLSLPKTIPFCCLPAQPQFSHRSAAFPLLVTPALCSHGHIHEHSAVSCSISTSSHPPLTPPLLPHPLPACFNSLLGTNSRISSRVFCSRCTVACRSQRRSLRRCIDAVTRSPGANIGKVWLHCTFAFISLLSFRAPFLILTFGSLYRLISCHSCVGQLMSGEAAGPDVTEIMQKIAASIGSYSAQQAASAPCSAADILEGASKEFLVSTYPRPPLQPLPSRLSFNFFNGP
jgi:hypothetical protein